MGYRTSILLPVILLSLSFSACSIFQGGEPAVAEDAPPPPGYAPLYVRTIAPLTTNAVPTISVGRIDVTSPNNVRMYVHVIDTNGTYLTGGSSGKWKMVWCELFERFNGELRPIGKYQLREATENDRNPHAVALVMDHSGSMGETRALTIQNAAERFVNLKKGEDAVALIKYDNVVGVEAPLTDRPADLISKLVKNGLTGYGKLTAIADGIAAGIREVSTAPAGRRRAVIVMTDGEDNSSTISRDSVIALARRNNVAICALDFGYGVNQAYLSGIASATGGLYRRIYKTDELDDAFEDIYRRLRNYYVFEYTPRNYGVHEVILKFCLPRDSASASAFFDNTPDIGMVSMLDVNFDVDKTDLTPSSRPALDNIYVLMKAMPTLRIEVRGHTDSTNSTGDPGYNMMLSQRRAESVRRELLKRGIEPDRVTAVGFGDTMPLADNGTEEGRSRNRRTEFVVLSR